MSMHRTLAPLTSSPPSISAPRGSPGTPPWPATPAAAVSSSVSPRSAPPSWRGWTVRVGAPSRPARYPDDMDTLQAIAGTLEASWADYSFLALMAECQQIGALRNSRQPYSLLYILTFVGQQARSGGERNRKAGDQALEHQRRSQPAQRLQGGHRRPRREHDRRPAGVHRRLRGHARHHAEEEGAR